MKADKRDLQALREEMEAIDREILECSAGAWRCRRRSRSCKLDNAFPFRDKQREEQLLLRIRHLAAERNLDAHEIERLSRLILEMSIARQHAHIRDLETAPLRVAYQGVEGSYSHLTAQRHYKNQKGGVVLTGYETVRTAAEAVLDGTVDVALLPIENSTAGSINETYDQLSEGGLTINTEVVSQVEHCLLALTGTRIEDLRIVMSHPQALLQCAQFLRERPWLKPQAEFDTAGAARKVRESNDRTLAAIAASRPGARSPRGAGASDPDAAEQLHPLRRGGARGGALSARRTLQDLAGAGDGAQAGRAGRGHRRVRAARGESVEARVASDPEPSVRVPVLSRHRRTLGLRSDHRHAARDPEPGADARAAHPRHLSEGHLAGSSRTRHPRDDARRTN